MCGSHNHRHARYGDPLGGAGYRIPRTDPNPCSIDGCDNRSSGRGLCANHYKQWQYRQDPEKYRGWERRRRLVDGDRVRALDNTNHAENPYSARHGSKRRKARVRGAEGSHTHVEWLAKLVEYDGLCVYCFDVATPQDHFIPITAGGSDYIDNIVPACLRCNCSKGTRPLHVFLWPEVYAA